VYKVHTQPIKRPSFGFNKGAKRQPKALWSGSTGLSGVHRTVSGAPPDSVRCTRGIRLQLATFGKIQCRRAIIHRTVRCTPDSVRCSKEARPPELASLGNAQQPLRYNSPDCPVYTGLSGATTQQRLFRRQRLSAAHLMRAARAQMSGAPILAHRTRNSRCPVPGGPRSQKLQRQ
jgi:hypothetical protein